MQLETQRLIIRELQDSDFDLLYAILGDSDIMKHYSYTFDEKRVHNWINRNKQRYAVYGFGLFAMVLKSSGEMIGDVGITMQNINGFIRPEVGYHVKKEYQRQGFASEGARACISWMFANTPFKQVFSYMTSDNVASYSCAEKLGLKLCEEYNDPEEGPHKVYSITKEKWELHETAGNKYNS